MRIKIRSAIRFFSATALPIAVVWYTLTLRHTVTTNRALIDISTEWRHQMDSKAADPFTGQQGRELADRISKLEHERKQVP